MAVCYDMQWEYKIYTEIYDHIIYVLILISYSKFLWMISEYSELMHGIMENKYLIIMNHDN